VRILFLVSLLFVAVINPYSVFKLFNILSLLSASYTAQDIMLSDTPTIDLTLTTNLFSMIFSNDLVVVSNL